MFARGIPHFEQSGVYLFIDQCAQARLGGSGVDGLALQGTHGGLEGPLVHLTGGIERVDGGRERQRGAAVEATHRGLARPALSLPPAGVDGALEVR